jgi:hypothetical protein
VHVNPAQQVNPEIEKNIILMKHQSSSHETIRYPASPAGGRRLG